MSLKKLSFLSRSQLQILHRLGGERNANRILGDMSQYLNSVRLHEKVYYLNSEGRALVGCEKVFKKTGQIRHYLLRNALYIAYGCPSTWRNEVKLSVPNEVTVIPDALFESDGRYVIVEVDCTQKMAVNREKVRRYRQLIALNVFKKPPAFIWITETDYRQKQLTKLCEGLQVRVHLAKDFNL
ncbi:replication-relaxation family protein [Bacillus sp. JJ722]